MLVVTAAIDDELWVAAGGLTTDHTMSPDDPFGDLLRGVVRITGDHATPMLRPLRRAEVLGPYQHLIDQFALERPPSRRDESSFLRGFHVPVPELAYRLAEWRRPRGGRPGERSYPRLRSRADAFEWLLMPRVDGSLGIVSLHENDLGWCLVVPEQEFEEAVDEFLRGFTMELADKAPGLLAWPWFDSVRAWQPEEPYP